MATLGKRSVISLPDFANIHQVLPCWTLRHALHGYHSLDLCRPVRLARSGTVEALHDTALALNTTHHFPRTCIEPATAPRLLSQHRSELQRTNARSHPPIFPTYRVWRCDS
jgi:hypothetical protein